MVTPGDDHGTAGARATLSIGDLAEQTGLTPSGLRRWEQRFGFPTAQRLAGGHRRYTDHDVDLVREVTRHQAAGARLEEAIALVLARAAPASPSVFATLRTRHPQLEVNRMHKSTLLAMSWAIEDQIAAMASPAVLWGVFQNKEFYRRSTSRWRDLDVVSGGATVFTDFEESDPGSNPRRVALPPGAPMLREWAVVIDATDFPVALSAWELPGQDAVPSGDRIFEAIWTLDPVAVRDAARVCAEVARSIDPRFHQGRYATPPPLTTANVDLSFTRVGSMLGRMAAYVDRFSTSSARPVPAPVLEDA